MYINETFGARTDDTSNSWISPSAGSAFSTDGTFADHVCYIYGVDPTSLPPQSPLLNTKVFHLTPQSWFVGSQTNGSGIEVQTDTLQYYTDHGRHGDINSPVR